MKQGALKPSFFENPVDQLCTAPPWHSRRVCAAIQNFYNQTSLPAPSFPVGREITGSLANVLWAAFEKAKGNFQERSRMKSLSETFIMIGGKLDDLEPLAPPYHNRAHNLTTMAVRFMRGRAAESFSGRPFTAFEITNEMRDLLAALGHDIGHDGSNNSASGVYKPGALEKASFEILRPYAQKAGVSEKDALFICHSLYGTDPGLPGRILLCAYKEVLHGNFFAPSREEIMATIMALPKEQRIEPHMFLAALEGDEALLQSAASLKGCDMVSSFGLDPAFGKLQSQKLHKESPFPIVDEKDEPLPAGQLFALFHFIGVGLCDGKKPRPQALFVDPVLDRLFGQNLRRAQSLYEQSAGPETVRSLWKGLPGGCPDLSDGPA